MVAVRMVSEGVDVPRLAVGVYATTTSTPLFFAQAVGRFVRARGRGETASVFLPSVPALLGYAAEMERERDHVLGRRDHRRGRHLRRRGRAARRGPRRGRRPPTTCSAPSRRWAREAQLRPGALRRREFGHAGEVHVGSEEEMDFLGIPGLLEPDQVATLLHQRQTERRREAEGPRDRTPDRSPRSHARAAGGAAPRAQRPGRRLAPPHRPAPRRHPRRAAQGVRRAGRRGRQRRPAARRGSTGSASGPPARRSLSVLLRSMPAETSGEPV